jgi:hypothetical protein
MGQTRLIVTIDIATFNALGVVPYRVADYCPPSQISVPEDDEIVLVYRGGQEFPEGVIADVL